MSKNYVIGVLVFSISSPSKNNTQVRKTAKELVEEKKLAKEAEKIRKAEEREACRKQRKEDLIREAAEERRRKEAEVEEAERNEEVEQIIGRNISESLILEKKLTRRIFF